MNKYDDLRIAVIGCPGSGKSTFGNALSKSLDIPFYPEIFENNPYLSSDVVVPDELITLWQLRNIEQRESSHSFGIFDTNRTSNVSIYLNHESRERLMHLYVPSQDYRCYDLTVAICPSLETLIERIKKRARDPLFLDRELSFCRNWFYNFKTFIEVRKEIDAFDEPTIYFDGEHSVTDMVSYSKDKIDCFLRDGSI